MNKHMDANLASQLAQRVKKMDRSALVEVYDCYSAAIYRYALRLLGDPDRAEECLAETFSRLLQAVQAGRGPDQHLQAYLYRVAHNWITDQYRRQPPEPLPLDESSQDVQPGVPVLADERLARAAVRSALARLTPDQRQVVVLKYIEGWETAEIARAVGKPAGAVKSLQHRALAALRRLLAQEVDGYEDRDG
jgi:RNA polymerase sigma-70 factor (ECF subfamily)